MKDLRECSLLVISDRYPHPKDLTGSSFVKNQIEHLKGYFDNIYIIALAPIVPKFLSRFDFMEGRGRWDGYAEDYNYDNVDVYFAKSWALPMDFSRKRRGDDGFKSAVRVIEKNKIEFDLIHAHFTYPCGYVGARLKQCYGKRLVLTVHEDRGWFQREIASGDSHLIYAWQNADRIIRVNRADLSEFGKLNIEKSKLIYLPNGFSPKLFRSIGIKVAREKLGVPQDRLVLLNLAALEPYKGQEFLIRAIQSVIHSKKNVLLYIVGKGSLREYLQSLINQCDLQDEITLAGGNKSALEISLWMNCCDVFVLPSLSESFGIVQIEAMACGKPVVATYNGGSEEVIVDESLGVLAEPRDADSLACAIIKAIDTKWDTDRIKNYADQFTWDKIAKRLVQIYENVMEKGD